MLLTLFQNNLRVMGTQFPVVLNTTVGTSCSVAANKTLAPVNHSVVLNAVVGTVASLTKQLIPAPPVPYRVKRGNITQGGSVGDISITPDPLMPPQEFLNVNFPTVSGGGGNLGVNALDFPGADLGAKINAASAAGHYHIFTPNSAGLVISTPIRIKHSMTLQFSERYPQFIDCKTNNKPVFEATDNNVRNFNIDGGFFQGNAVQTPSCLLLLASNSTLSQQGSCKPLSNIESQGHWGLGTVIHIGAEVTVYENCKINQLGKGDSPWAGPQATVRIANADYWGVPFAYTQPNLQQRSTSAIVFENCQFGADMQNLTQSMMLMKGQVEDVTVNGTYMNAVGRCHFLFEPGFTALNGWTQPRRIKIEGGGRSECNKGVNWAGVPFVEVDNLGQPNMGMDRLTIGSLGIFLGGAGGSVPIVNCINGGRIDSLYMTEPVFIFGTDTFLKCNGADLEWAELRIAPSNPQLKINCAGRTIANSHIHMAGDILGTVAASSRVRANNFNNW